MNRRGLSTQPWGAQVLNTRVEEVWLLIQTAWGLFVRKSRVLSLPVHQFRLDTADFLGRGTIVSVLKQVGTLSCDSDMMNISVVSAVVSVEVSLQSADTSALLNCCQQRCMPPRHLTTVEAAAF